MGRRQLIKKKIERERERADRFLIMFRDGEASEIIKLDAVFESLDFGNASGHRHCFARKIAAKCVLSTVSASELEWRERERETVCVCVNGVKYRNGRREVACRDLRRIPWAVGVNVAFGESLLLHISPFRVAPLFDFGFFLFSS